MDGSALHKRKRIQEPRKGDPAKNTLIPPTNAAGVRGGSRLATTVELLKRAEPNPKGAHEGY
jgi:hypothetical protein